jgi:hypothetical protein
LHQSDELEIVLVFGHIVGEPWSFHRSANSYQKRRRLGGFVTPHSADTLALSTCHCRGDRVGQVLLWGSK